MDQPPCNGENGDDKSLDDLVGNEDVEKLAGSFETVVAKADYEGEDETYLSFKLGQKLTILSKETIDWWWGESEGTCGYIPANHVTTEDEMKRHSEWQDEEYFGSYAELKLQLEMLTDRPRTLAYRSAIVQHADFLRGKTILDVGSGSGILGMFCAREGGARKVYAVEASNMADLARDVIRQNCLDGTVSVFKGRMEEVELPEKVDLIISEWMGTFLFFEYMVETVLYARDHWLKPGGITWPSRAQLHLVPCTAQKLFADYIAVWDDHYGFDFSPFKEEAREEFLQRPIHDYELKSKDCLSDSAVLLDVNLQSLLVEDLSTMSGKFSFKVTKSGMFCGMCSWFSVTFGGVPVITSEGFVVLSTGPDQPLTHWKQNLFPLDEPVKVTTGNVISGQAVLTRNKQFKRHLTVKFSFEVFQEDSALRRIEKQFKIWS